MTIMILMYKGCIEPWAQDLLINHFYISNIDKLGNRYVIDEAGTVITLDSQKMNYFYEINHKLED